MEVALMTEVFKTGDGVKVAPSVPASTCVEVLVTVGLVALIVATCFSVKVFVVYTVTIGIEVDELVLLEVSVEETVLEETVGAAQGGTLP
jgi:hypothetical protein